MPKKVLIIEDTADISGALQQLIELEGYAAVVASDGAEGREKAISEKPDLILMDLRLPDMDGIELTRLLRSLPETAEIPILCVSSYAADHNRKNVLAAGCQEVFTKSSFIESFRPTLEKYLGPP